MRIDSNSWHCRLYLWWYEKKYGFPNEKGFSNLCPYMRAVMFWVPFRVFFGTWIKMWGVPLNAITLPPFLYIIPKLLGYVSYIAKFSCIMIESACSLAIVTALICHWAEKQWPTKSAEDKPKSKFKALVTEYFRSAHDRVCPEIDWK